ncbi:MAG: hypothetical protein ABWZ85_07750, partial [Luteibacter sp.]
MLLRHILSLVLVLTGLAACHDDADRTQGGQAPAPARATADKDTQSAPEGLYTMELKLPDLPGKAAPLRAAIEHYVDRQKRAFLDSLDSPGAR